MSILFRHEAVVHALKVRQAVQIDDYHSFFKLYQTTPNMGNYLLDLMIDSYRLQTLQKMCKSYKPSLPVPYVLKELAFENDEIGIDFMGKCACIFQEAEVEGQDDAPVATKNGKPVKKQVDMSNVQKLEWNTKDTVIDMSMLTAQDKLLL